MEVTRLFDILAVLRENYPQKKEPESSLLFSEPNFLRGLGLQCAEFGFFNFLTGIIQCHTERGFLFRR